MIIKNYLLLQAVFNPCFKKGKLFLYDGYIGQRSIKSSSKWRFVRFTVIENTSINTCYCCYYYYPTFTTIVIVYEWQTQTGRREGFVRKPLRRWEGNPWWQRKRYTEITYVVNLTCCVSVCAWMCAESLTESLPV